MSAIKSSGLVDAALLNKVLKQIDFDTLVKEVQPQVEKEIKVALIRYFKDDFYIDDFVDDKIIANGINKLLTKAFGGK